MKAAVIQMCSGTDWQQNLAAAESLCRDALMADAELLVLPENFVAWGAESLALFSRPEHSPLDEVLRRLIALCQQAGVYIFAGTIPFLETGASKPYARQYLLGPDGILAHYDKLHLFDVKVDDAQGRYQESAQFNAGAGPKAVSLASWNVGMSTCFDVRFPQLYQHYRQAGVDVLTLPSAFTYVTGKAHWQTLIQARAIETQSYVLAANQVGQHDAQRRTWGQSMIVDPWGRILASCDQEEPGFACAYLDRGLIDQIRTSMRLSSPLD